MKLENLVVYITGGASGLGEASAKLLASYGCKIAIADLNVERGTALVKEIGEKQCVFFKTDVTQEKQVEASIDKTVEHFGAINVLVNSAGSANPVRVVYQDGSFFDTDAFKKLFDINVFACAYAIKYATKYMIKQEKLNEYGERGVIINISSAAAWCGTSTMVGYSATKAGLSGMTLPMARDLGRFGHSCSICQSWVHRHANPERDSQG